MKVFEVPSYTLCTPVEWSTIIVLFLKHDAVVITVVDVVNAYMCVCVCVFYVYNTRNRVCVHIVYGVQNYVSLINCAQLTVFTILTFITIWRFFSPNCI